MVTARGEKNEEGHEGMKFNLADKLAMKRGVNVRELKESKEKEWG